MRARAERIYHESLRELLRIYKQLMLGKEMRLYAKIKLELSQSAGLPFRTIESLLTMAEVDIICDDSQQAHAKLNGAEALLAATGALSEATADVTLRRCKAKKAASDASPVLHATRDQLY